MKTSLIRSGSLVMRRRKKTLSSIIMTLEKKKNTNSVSLNPSPNPK